MKTTYTTSDRYLNLEYKFVRRRYGKMQFFTWLHYSAIGTDLWEDFGDPWPKARLNRHELIEALNTAVVRTTKPGTRVRTLLGDGVIVEGITQPGCLLAAIEGIKCAMPLHPNSIIEVLAPENRY